MAQFSRADYFSIFGWGVGNKEFLASEQSKVAKYYRLIEGGTKGFIGRKIAGVFTSGGAPVPFGAFNPDERFRSLAPSPSSEEVNLTRGARAGLVLLREAGYVTGGTNRDGKYRGDIVATRGVVKKEIQPHEVYLKTARAFDPLKREIEAIRKAFAAIGIQGDVRATAAADNVTIPRAAKQEVSRSAAESGTGFINVRVLGGASQSIARQGAPIRPGLNLNAAGTFTTYVTQLRQANYALAVEYQRLLVKELKDSLKRPGASSKRLEEAYASERNRFPKSPTIGA